jgi:REP element-mobilizing transposase RayT
VTNRTLEERCYLRPDELTNAAVVKSLAVALRSYPVELAAFVFMGNHYHLVVRAGEHSVSDFVGIFQSRLARAVNERLGRRGPVWQRRFVATPIVDESALLERIEYTVMNPVKARLVDSPDAWPGVLSHDSRGNPRCYSTPLRLRMQEKEETVTIVPSEVLRSNWSFELPRRKGRALGAARVLATDLEMRPRHSKRSPAPLCHASSAHHRRVFQRQRRSFYAAYEAAAERYRYGDVMTVFPCGSYPPSRYPKVDTVDAQLAA